MNDAPPILDLSAGPPSDKPQGFRPGQWVKFKRTFNLPGAHISADGQSYVAIYHPATQTSAATIIVNGVPQDLPPTVLPERIIVVRPNCLNLEILDEEGNRWPVVFAPTAVQGLEPAKVPDDLPQGPKTAHLFGNQATSPKQ